MPAPFDARAIRALVFDVFGTVVDWRGSIIREGESTWRTRGHDIDWGAFADAWRRQYQPQMQRVRSGELPWTNLDALHRMGLDTIAPEFGLDGLSESEQDELTHAWHRLDPWPDAVEGLSRLKQRYVLATCSNGNIALMVNMAKRAGLAWDAILGAETARHYKPDRETYLSTVELLGLVPSQVMMVAAHPPDLEAAAACGLRTALVPRPLEFGPEREARTRERNAEAAGRFDIEAPDFIALAARLEQLS